MLIQTNMRLLYRSGLILIALLWPGCSIFAQDTEHIILGEKTKFYSNIFDKEIQLSIHVPGSYEDSEEEYPVLYVFQVHFEQVSGAVKNLYDYGLIPELMVVSVDSYEYGWLTPTKLKRDPNSGQANDFLQFFKEELFPHIDSKYRTRPYQIVFSNSWGAMFGVYAILARPDVFNAALASIPWVAYDREDRFMINNAKQFLDNGHYHSHFLYMTMDDESALLPDLEAFISVLRDNAKPSLTWEYHHWPEEDHTSTPYRTVYSGLRSLFRERTEIPDEVVDNGQTAILEFEQGLNVRFGFNLGLSGGALRSASRRLLDQDRHEEAYAILKYNVEKYPDDPFALVTLGRAYEENNELDLAKETFEKAYQLASESSARQIKWVKSHLDRITEFLDAAKDSSQ